VSSTQRNHMNNVDEKYFDEIKQYIKKEYLK